jgi:hypothetical protein
VLINAFFVAQESGRLLKVESSQSLVSYFFSNDLLYHDGVAALALGRSDRLAPGRHSYHRGQSLNRLDALALATDLRIRTVGIPIACSIARAAALHSIPRFSDRSSFANSGQALERTASLPLLAMCNDSVTSRPEKRFSRRYYC